jgi:transposase-like protein
MKQGLKLVTDLPAWVPETVRLYLDHTEDGVSFRELARREGVHPSTILRMVRRFETRRDDPLMDAALSSLAKSKTAPALPMLPGKDAPPMSAPLRHANLPVDEALIRQEGMRILRRLAEPGAVLAIAADMEKAAVLREFPDGKSARTAVVDGSVAQAFLLKDWIICRRQGRIATYELSGVGRSALKRMLHEDGAEAGMAEAPMAFAGQHREWAERDVTEASGTRRVRYNLAESPVAVLGRRREKDGNLFLEADLVEAAERLREDFELAQMGPRVAQNWERFLTGSDRGGFKSDSGLAEGPNSARERVALALRELGPGLGDVALRVCCFLEGIETAERRMGWAARSGKIVLRIALQRLRRHYDQTYGRSGPLIG